MKNIYNFFLLQSLFFFFPIKFLLQVFSALFYNFSFFSLSQLPAMSKRRRSGLAPDELEIQEVLSPSGSQRTMSADNVTPAQAPRARAPPLPTSQQPPPIQVHPQPAFGSESMKQLSEMVSQSLIVALTTAKISGLQIGGPIDYIEPEEPMQCNEEGEEEEGDDFCDLPSGRPAGARTDGPAASDKFFGVHVNEPTAAPVHPGPAPAAPLEPQVVVQPIVPEDDIVVPDASLPGSSSDVPPNWHPLSSVLAWANHQIDNCEFSAADRDAIIKQFVPEVQFQHLFEAVPTPPDLLTALKHPATKESDYLFRRSETENFLYTANRDLCCGLRPLIEVISGLTGIPDQERNRFLLGQVYQCLSSAVSHLSRGRRELGRRFVPLTNAAALYRRKPSHLSIFGGSSVSEAVQGAVAESKVNKDLVILPKKRQLPFRVSHPGNKQGGQEFKTSRGSSQTQQQQYYNTRKFQNRRGGKKSRGRGKRRQAKASTQD